MNESYSTSTTELILRRMEEPLRLFGTSLPGWVWLVILGFVLALGFFYISWMYLRDSRTVGPWWASFLGLLRASVYIILALVFLLPARQTWHENRQRSKVILVFDVSRSMGTTRDEVPPEGRSLSEMPTRQDKVLQLLQDDNILFLERLEKTNPVTAYRFSRSLDRDYRHFEQGQFWPRSARDQWLAQKAREENRPEGLKSSTEHWESWLFPDKRKDVPAGWEVDSPQAKELLRQVADNKVKVEAKFFDATTIGESLVELIKQERNNMVQGIV